MSCQIAKTEYWKNMIWLSGPKMLKFGSTIWAAQLAARPKSSVPFYENLSIYVSPRVSGVHLTVLFPLKEIGGWNQELIVVVYVDGNNLWNKHQQAWHSCGFCITFQIRITNIGASLSLLSATMWWIFLWFWQGQLTQIERPRVGDKYH